VLDSVTTRGTETHVSHFRATDFRVKRRIEVVTGSPDAASRKTFLVSIKEHRA
jgi:hypothetical protein